MNERGPGGPWRVPVSVHEVPASGRRFELEADAATRAAIAKSAGLRALPRLQATFDVSRHGAEGLHVVGRVRATVGQECVVSLDPIDNEVDETVDLIFVAGATPAAGDAPAGRPWRSGTSSHPSRSSTTPSISAPSPPSSCCSGSSLIRASRTRSSRRRRSRTRASTRSQPWRRCGRGRVAVTGEPGPPVASRAGTLWSAMVTAPAGPRIRRLPPSRSSGSLHAR